MQSPVFLVSFHTTSYLFGFTKGLSQSLQGSTLNVVDGYNLVKVVTDQLQEVRANAEEEFSKVYRSAEEMAHKAGVSMSVPRTCAKQMLRNNTEAME